MSIAERIEDAHVLWDNNRYDGAFLNVLVAVAATSRLRYPNRNQVSDRKAFTQFLASSHQPVIEVEFRGRLESLPDIFYIWLRCELIHEGAIPVDIQFMTDKTPGSLAIRAGGAPGFTLLLSRSWFYYLLESVKAAPENSSLFVS